MLQGLDAIDWSSWETAYGPATGVPDQLRAIAGDDAAAARSALDRLESSVNHQGIASLAAVPTTPFLVAIARERPSPRLVRLIADLGCAGSHAFVAGGEPLSDALFPELQPVRDAVAGAWDLFAGLLDDRSADLRAAAAVGLGTAFERVAEARGCLVARLPKERSGPVLATIAGALGRLAVEDGHRETAELVGGLLTHKSAPVALAARIAAAMADPTTERLAELLRIARPGEPARGVAWFDGRLDDLALALALDGLATRGEVAILAEAVRTRGIHRVARPLLRAALGPRPRSPEVLRPDAIPASARPVLELIARHFPPPTNYGAGFEAPEEWGLRSLPRLLGVVPPRTLDRAIDGEPLWWVGAEVRAGRRPLAAWEAALATLDPDALEDLARDLVATPTPYRLDLPRGSGWDAWDVADGYAALVRATVTRLGTERTEHWLRREQLDTWRLVPVVDAWSAALEAEGNRPPEDLDALLAEVVDTNGIDPRVARRITARLGPERAERLVLALAPDLLVTRHADGADRPALRGALLVADLAPTPAVRERALGWLATDAWLAHDLDPAQDEPIAVLLASVLGAFDTDTPAEVERAAASAAGRDRGRWAGILGRTAALLRPSA